MSQGSKRIEMTFTVDVYYRTEVDKIYGEDADGAVQRWGGMDVSQQQRGGQYE